MQRKSDIELYFPIKDVASAALMLIKADRLHKAGIINTADKRWVHSRARKFLQNATLNDLTQTSTPASRRHVGGRTADNATM